MVFYEVFSHPELRIYKTTLVSKATLVQLIAICISLLSPFLIAYFTGGFWIREKSYHEQPLVNFQYRYIAVLEGDLGVYLSSSYDNLNEIFANEYRPVVINANEIDTNDDNYVDSLQMSLFISAIPSTEIIRSLKLLLLFNTSLSAIAKMQFESIAYLEATNSKRASGLTVSGRLGWSQNMLIRQNFVYNEYNYQTLNQTNLHLEGLDLASIVEAFGSRKYGTTLEKDQVSWSNRNAYGFTINIQIKYPFFQISYIPWFWEQFKYGWIQYIAILIPFLYVFNIVKVFIFENQLVNAICMNSEKGKKL